MMALYAAAEGQGVARFIQISAVGAHPAAPALFMSTKGEADRALAASKLDWVVLRPGLVIGPAAYGGTALLRALASFPFVTPALRNAGLVQSVAVEDVALAVVTALEGRVASRAVYDLVENERHTLDAVLAGWRAALGRPPIRALHPPRIFGSALFRLGDLAGWLGWRPPMRTTALRQIEAGVTGDPRAWRAAGGQAMRPLADTLRRLPSTAQERWFGRLYLLKPAIVVTLALFWCASGAITLADPRRAAAVLDARGAPALLSNAVVWLGSAVDLALGVAILFRRTHVAAAIGMIATTSLYLAGASLFAPDLWLDPLGPLVKTIPAALLAFVALAIEEER